MSAPPPPPDKRQKKQKQNKTSSQLHCCPQENGWQQFSDRGRSVDDSRCTGREPILKQDRETWTLQWSWPLIDPCLTFDPTNVLHFGQGFFWPNLTYMPTLVLELCILHINKLICIFLNNSHGPYILTAKYPCYYLQILHIHFVHI